MLAQREHAMCGTKIKSNGISNNFAMRNAGAGVLFFYSFDVTNFVIVIKIACHPHRRNVGGPVWFEWWTKPF